MTEVECKMQVRQILSKVDFKYDKKIKDVFWNSCSNEQASAVLIGDKCYTTIVKIIRDSIDKTSGIDNLAENQIKDVLSVWNDCLVDNNSFDANIALSKVEKINLKVHLKDKETYLSNVIKNIDRTLEEIEQSVLLNDSDAPIKVEMLKEIKNDLNTNVLCTNTREAGECYEIIIDCLKNIRQSANTKTKARKEVISNLQDAVEKWISLTKGNKSIFKKTKAEKVDFTNDDLTYNVKYQEEKGYFNDLIKVLDDRIKTQDGPMEDALSQYDALDKKLAILKDKYTKGEVSKEQFVRIAKPIAEDLKIAQARVNKITAATSSSLKNAKMIRNRLYDLFMLADASSLSTKEKYEMIHNIDASKVMSGLALNDDSMKFFITLKSMEKQLTETIAYSNKMYNDFLIPHMNDILPEELDEDLEDEKPINVDEEFDALFNTQTKSVVDNKEVENKKDEMSDEELKKIFNI